jgi:hypothetical protein
MAPNFSHWRAGVSEPWSNAKNQGPPKADNQAVNGLYVIVFIGLRIN